MEFGHEAPNQVVRNRDTLTTLVASEALVGLLVCGTRLRKHDEQSGQIIAPGSHSNERSTEHYKGD